jgi:hypothetical protein
MIIYEHGASCPATEEKHKKFSAGNLKSVYSADVRKFEFSADVESLDEHDSTVPPQLRRQCVHQEKNPAY